MSTYGGHSLKNGVQVCAALKIPFSWAPGRSQDPHQHFQFSEPYFHPNHKFPEILRSKASELANSSGS